MLVEILCDEIHKCIKEEGGGRPGIISAFQHVFMQIKNYTVGICTFLY